MPRVASLYLPNLAIDRLRRIEAPDGRRHDTPTALNLPLPLPAEPEVGNRIEDCSCPRGGGWRPGARWARREEMRAEAESLPLHQQPPLRELGRRSEAAQAPFRKSPAGRDQRPRSMIPPALADADEQPMVTIHRTGARMTIAAASPKARALGLHPGMAAVHAQTMVPGLIIRPAEPDADAAVLNRLALFAARRWTPRAAVSDPGGLWLDLGGVSHLFGGEAMMCRRILLFLARLGYAARIAVAGTPGAAHALARHSNQAISLCPSGREADALSPLSLAALRVEEEVLNGAGRLGIETIGELIAMPRAPLARRFGRTLLARLDMALGRIGEVFDPVVPENPPSASLRFVEPIVTPEAIGQVVTDLTMLLVEELGRQGLGARALTLLCDRVDGERQPVSIGTARATRDGNHIRRLLAGRIGSIEPGFGIEALHLVARRCEPLAPQPVASALGGAVPAPDLAPLIDRLAGRLGTRRVFRFSAVESDVPERSVRRIAPLGDATGWPPAWPRPVRLLTPPERIENVVALLPDQPPRRFSWRGHVHIVRKADGPERIHGEWWRQASEAEGVRDYFQVEDEAGGRFWLFRRGDGEDGRTGDMSWWLQGVFG